jgi:ubiquinone/menaquinone biosynthesis C-methylase UbiE
MSEDEPEGTFRVDQAADPFAVVRYLDTASAHNPIQHIKRQSYELLGARGGQRLLDVGCGTGDDVRALAEMVGLSGRVTGVDASAVMIAEAKMRSEGCAFPVDFVQADGAALPFADEHFDGCRAERLLQHVPDPEAALAELIRVARQGAHIVVVDSDHGMVGLNLTNRSLARRVLDVRCDAIRNGWIGRQLPGLMKRRGMVDIAVYPAVSMHLSLALQGDLERSVAEAERRGVISVDEGRAFVAELEELDRAGEFFLAGVIMTVVGCKP